MSKVKIFGLLESEQVLLEPTTETRYRLDTPVEASLVNAWVTVQGELEDSVLRQAEVVRVEKNTGKVSRRGVIVETAPNLPPEYNGQGGILYQPDKGRYYLLSTGPVDEPIQGDFSAYVDKNVDVRGQFGEKSYILYNAQVKVREEA